MSTVGSKLLRSARNARAFARGEATAGFVVHVPEDVDVRAIRRRTNLSQAAFAARYGFPAATVRDWEQGRRRPEAAARVLLLIIQRHPDVVEEVLQQSAA